MFFRVTFPSLTVYHFFFCFWDWNANTMTFLQTWQTINCVRHVPVVVILLPLTMTKCPSEKGKKKWWAANYQPSISINILCSSSFFVLVFFRLMKDQFTYLLTHHDGLYVSKYTVIPTQQTLSCSQQTLHPSNSKNTLSFTPSKLSTPCSWIDHCVEWSWSDTL